MATKATAAKQLHYHACITCKRRYPDWCPTPKVNHTCGSCRQGSLSVHQVGLDPHACCIESLRLVRTDELKTYRLVGTGPWWICAQCCRQFGYDVRIPRD